MNISESAAALWVQHVNAALTLCGCTTVEHVAMWIAQVREESAGLSRLSESLNYSVDALLTKFGRHRISEADARRLGRDDSIKRPADQNGIAMCIYGGGWGLDNLGNRPGTDDPVRYIGHGPIQVTGRANHIACGQAIGVDLDREPTLLELRSTGAASTAWYWRKHKLTGFNGDVRAVTRKIKGGADGWEKRQVWYDKAIAVLSGGELVRLS